jgi:hypothetical protein
MHLKGDEHALQSLADKAQQASAILSINDYRQRAVTAEAASGW